MYELTSQQDNVCGDLATRYGSAKVTPPTREDGPITVTFPDHPDAMPVRVAADGEYYPVPQGAVSSGDPFTAHEALYGVIPEVRVNTDFRFTAEELVALTLLARKLNEGTLSEATSLLDLTPSQLAEEFANELSA